MEKSSIVARESADKVDAWPFGLLVFAVVLLSALFGIYTRPVGFLASVWPANALMLGVLVNHRGRTAFGWVAGSVAFLLADLLTGSTLGKTALLTAGNLAGIATAYAVFSRLPPETVHLRKPNSVLGLLVASAAGAAAAGIVGAIINPILFGGGIAAGWMFWFVTEFVNYLTILPIILTLPNLTDVEWRELIVLRPFWRSAAPAVSLLLSFGFSVMVGGPGAIAFPVPALLWCSIDYPIFAVTALTLLFGMWTMLAISAGYLPGTFDLTDEDTLISVRIGVALITLGPIMLASVMAERTKLLDRMRYLADHDPLTGALVRRAFHEQVARKLSPDDEEHSFLLIDVDHFKAVNDTRGHALGDMVLAMISKRIAGVVREADLLGRFGGEEFAVFLPSCPSGQAVLIAEQIRRTVSGQPMVSGPHSVDVTVSIGVSSMVPAGLTIEEAIHNADMAMYRAKKEGRNRVIAFGTEWLEDFSTFAGIKSIPPARDSDSAA